MNSKCYLASEGRFEESWQRMVIEQEYTSPMVKNGMNIVYADYRRTLLLEHK